MCEIRQMEQSKDYMLNHVSETEQSSAFNEEKSGRYSKASPFVFHVYPYTYKLSTLLVRLTLLLDS